MPEQDLYLTSEQLQLNAPMQSHSSLMRTITKALEELTQCGLVEHRAGTWAASGTIVAKTYEYQDSMQRSRQAVRFGTWIALVLVLKVTRLETRMALREAIKKNPMG